MATLLRQRTPDRAVQRTGGAITPFLFLCLFLPCLPLSLQSSPVNLELQQELFGWVELFVGSVFPALLLLLCVCGRRLRVGCWLLPVAVLLGWAGLLFIWERYGFSISMAAAEARHDEDYEPNGVGLLFLGWMYPFLPCALTLMVVYLFRTCGHKLPPSVQPNHALQRIEAGGEPSSDLRA